MKGSCACGAVEYEIDSIDMPIGHCHCHTCRKTHAAAFASTAGVKREHFRWLKGQERLTAYESSPGKLRHFCSRCGSHLMAERPALPLVIVRVATLDEDPGVVAEQHIWVSHDVPWLQYEEMAEYPQWQPGR
ncbi:GFA family protein [Pseudomonas sp. FEN]|uniref:GFA family protein n=1 Tax=Pseudomonas sp. FEN TaxID=2767468 RepID=UPI00174B5897|nr:GFA family protein [Pseudomonas sp. FEN]CAD5201187.1 ADP-ribosylglycohydrolase family protein [Pseudomonas sp. FEN]